jgi:di-heme oxidoreductase (putative peroxidase)
MNRFTNRAYRPVTLIGLALASLGGGGASGLPAAELGREVAIPRHLQDGEEFQLPVKELIAHGQKLFTAVWTIQEGGGRPLTKGTGAALSDPSAPLLFPRNFNRLSAPDANSCAGCHNQPFGTPGGHGDIVANVFVLGQRFDFATFDRLNFLPTKSSVDELGRPVTQQSIADSRITIGMFGSGFIEMLARQITGDLQAIRDATLPGEVLPLVSKGISYGAIARRADGTWDTSQVEGIPTTSLASSDQSHPPSLIIRPFHQAANRVSLRDFSNTAFNHHHGIQSTERFGLNTDPDGDGVVNELTRADMTAVVIFQATMAVPGRVIPNDPEIEAAVLTGEQTFQTIGCAVCHVPSLPLDNQGFMFSEPNPYNPPGNLRPGQAPELRVNLLGDDLPQPRLKPNQEGTVNVPAFTDMKLHDICAGPDDPNAERLDMNQPAGSMGFFEGNRKFITKKLWGCGNQPPFFHHGQFTTMRQAILAHSGEADASRQAFEALSAYERNSIIEFLKTLQVLLPGTMHLIVDEEGRPKEWPPRQI